MANEEIIDLLDLVERGKGAASPSSSRGASDFKRELDDLFSDEPESADAGHAETYDRKARPSGNAAAASGKTGQAVDFNEKLDMPDMSDLDGIFMVTSSTGANGFTPSRLSLSTIPMIFFGSTLTTGTPIRSLGL